MFSVASENANASRVKGRHPHFFCDGTHQRCDSVFHLLGCFVGERDGKDLKWVDVADNTTTQDTYVDGSVVKYVAPTLSYAEKRQSEYPPLEEQFDEIYHNGIDSWKATIKVVKDKYPKE